MPPQAQRDQARPPSPKNTPAVQDHAPAMAWSAQPASQLPVKLLPASQFSWEELTHAYNQTRVDYLVPMPMNVARLRQYAHDYDVDVDASVVALEDSQVLGLAMLGVRPGHTWITRLGVLPVTRQRGIGQALMDYLVERSRRPGVSHIILEVIAGNEPAHRLFKRCGFQETRELLIMRRPPGPPVLEGSDAAQLAPYAAQAIDRAQALERLRAYRGTLSWLNEVPSLENAGQVAGLQVELESGGRGWLVYQNTVFQLGHVVLQTEAGDPGQVGQALLHALHARHPAQDTSTENVPGDDPHLPAMREMGYLESFRRIEMRLDL